MRVTSRLSSLPGRTAVAVPGIAAFLALPLVDEPVLTASVLGLVAALTGYEVVRLTAPGTGTPAFVTAALLCGGAAAAAGLLATPHVMLIPLVPGIAFALLRISSCGPERAAASLAGPLGMLALVAAGFGALVRLATGPASPWMMTVPLAACWVGDTAAFLTGNLCGRGHRMAPAVSPGKTWEGLLAGLAGSSLAVVLLSMVLPGLSALQGLAVGLAAGLAAVLGDLVESTLKRDAGVKDSGRLLLQHGGFLDRFDALVIAALVTWALLSIMRVTA